MPAARWRPARGAIGTLTISNTLTLQTRSLLSFDVNESAGTCDQVIGLTSVCFGGTLVLNNQAGAFAPSDAFKLFDARSYVGAFDQITPVTPGANMAWDTSTLTHDGTLRVTSTLSTNITAQASGGQLALSWPTDHTGWRLQAQTNLPHVGLTTNWVTVPGSAATNRLVTAVDPSVGSVFFRLAAPPFFISQFAQATSSSCRSATAPSMPLALPGFSTNTPLPEAHAWHKWRSQPPGPTRCCLVP